MTEYIVFAQSERGYLAKHGEPVEAASGDAAIRTVAEKNGNGTYIAVPVRNLTERTVKTEAYTKIRLFEVEQ